MLVGLGTVLPKERAVCSSKIFAYSIGKMEKWSRAGGRIIFSLKGNLFILLAIIGMRWSGSDMIMIVLMRDIFSC